MKIRTLLGALILLLTSAQASAISTVATINGLDWAALTDTTGVFENSTPRHNIPGHHIGSVPTIIDKYSGADPCPEGWCLANEAQVLDLFDEVLGAGGADVDSVNNWFDIFGITGTETGGAWSAGAYLDGTVLRMAWVFDFCHSLFNCSQPGGGLGGSDMLTAMDGYGYSVGLFLYRPSPIPIPAPVWLFGTALIGLVGFSKRRKAA